MNELTLFISSFLLVMLFGLQSQIVRLGHKLHAFFTSLGIGSLQVFAFKLVPDANIFEILAFIFGGATGIVVSIILHNYYVKVMNINDTRGISQ